MLTFFMQASTSAWLSVSPVFTSSISSSQTFLVSALSSSEDCVRDSFPCGLSSSAPSAELVDFLSFSSSCRICFSRVSGLIASTILYPILKSFIFSMTYGRRASRIFPITWRVISSAASCCGKTSSMITSNRYAIFAVKYLYRAYRRKLLRYKLSDVKKNSRKAK